MGRGLSILSLVLAHGEVLGIYFLKKKSRNGLSPTSYGVLHVSRKAHEVLNLPICEEAGPVHKDLKAH